jgi:GNAT superfamily N-acetyltransferase
VTTEIWRPALTAQFEIEGEELELIPLGARHRQLLADGFSRLSERSRFLRFMAPVSDLSASELSYLTELDLVDRFAWGLLVEGRPAAVGRYVKTAASEAEVGVTVADEYQGRGLGRLLVEALAVVAADVGLETFVFEVLAENRAMLSILERLGATTATAAGVVHARLPVGAVPPPPLDLRVLLETVHSARRDRSRHIPIG